MSNYKHKCEICPICLDTIRKVNSKRVIIQECCNKPFHKKCINKWYKIKKICPLCRTEKKDVPLFTSAETRFLSDSLVSIVPLLRPLYRSYGGDQTMSQISSFISICEDTVGDIITETVDNSTEINELTETLETAKNLVTSIRTMMNNQDSEII